MSGFKKPNFVDRRNTAAKAKKAALEKFRASAADPAFEERLGARIAGAVKRRTARNVREMEKVENKLHAEVENKLHAERAQQAERDAAIQAGHAAAESANREAERKAARDARYAARKSRSKR